MLNRKWLNVLYQKLGNNSLPDNYDTTLVAGSMFWFRPDSLRPLSELHIGPDDFEDELGQIDGTLAHAFERLFATCATTMGYTVDEIREPQGNA